MSTTEAENKELVRQVNEQVWDEGNLDIIDEKVADDYVGHNPAEPEATRGPGGFKEYARAAQSAFPDLEVTTEDVVCEGNKVCRRTRFTGTHEGEFMGIPPTGNTVDVSGMIIYRIQDGQIVESWGQNDLLGMMQQLGIIEPPGGQSDDEDTMATTPRENKELVQRFIRELVNGKNYDLADELFTAEYTRHDPDTPGDERGAEPFVEALKQLHEAFPDSEVHVGEIIAEDDLVAFEGTLTGTHEGDFRGIEPTNTEIEIPGNAMHRIRDGRIAETWATWNFLGALQQLGAVEPPGE